MQNRDAVDLIEGIDDLECTLNDWEEEFLSDVRKLVDEGHELSVKQGKCLEKIYAKESGGGDYQKRERF